MSVPPPRLQTALLVPVAMVAFAANSLLCRQALGGGAIDAASFTALRILSGAIALWLLVFLSRRGGGVRPHWPAAAALFAYAVCFSFAYLSLSAATGALILFAAVQITMIGAGLWEGELLTARIASGLLLAACGLVALLLPGLTAPAPAGALLMVLSGVAWGVYSLLGRRVAGALRVTAGNFIGAVPMALAVLLLAASRGAIEATSSGVVLALLSGALASGMGYAVWYIALRGLDATQAASVQLSVPVIAAAGGVLLLAEPVTARLLLASGLILGGIALVLTRPRPATA